MTTISRETPILVFTDLDGTLLDHHSYDWSPAAPWLARLRSAGVPVIPVTSKTRAELMTLREALGLADTPFVAENGAVIGLPRSWLKESESPESSGLRVLTPGANSAALARTLQALEDGWRKEPGDGAPVPWRRLSAQPLETVMALTGLDREAAQAARRREGSEPLIWDGDEAGLALFRAEVESRGLTLTRGGRFWHLMGEVDKGRAARFLVERFTELHGVTPLTLGLGDGPNDVPLLEGVDRAVLIRAAHGHPPAIRDGHVYRTRETGPRGWAEGLDHWLGEELP